MQTSTLPSCCVVSITTSLHGPAPTLVYALTRMEYSTYSSSPVRSTVNVEESTVVVLYIMAPLNVLWLYSTSYWVMIPFRSMAGTSSQVTRIAVVEMLTAFILSGGEAGAEEKEFIVFSNLYLYCTINICRQPPHHLLVSSPKPHHCMVQPPHWCMLSLEWSTLHTLPVQSGPP